MIVGVVGAGTMGAGIAQLCLQAGHEVVLYDVDEQAVSRGFERIGEGLDRAVAKGRLSADDAAVALTDRLRDAYGLDEVAGAADIVVEAALEDLELKRTLFRALDSAARAEAILATNTSALSVSEIAEATSRPERVVGLHFFNPAPVMALVEVVAGERSSGGSIERAVAFATGLGKTPVVCRDAPGFIVNRVNRPFTLEALRLLDASLASAEAIDAAIEAAGYPMGPFRLMDLVGIDVNLAVARALYQAFDQEARFRPSPTQERLVADGTLGRKTGRGFYLYPARPANPTSEAGGSSAADSSVRPEEIVERIELAIINEAYYAAGEDVASPADIDLALKLGAGHPYGPFERAGQLGLRAVVDGLARLAQLDEPDAPARFRVAQALWSMAAL